MPVSKHIVLLQSAHHQQDDRVFYHQSQTLMAAGHKVDICDYVAFPLFKPYAADIYIVDTPKAMWRVRRTHAKVVYDITEWYPSKKNLRHLRFGKLCKAIILFCASLWAGFRADAFIFGEEDKAVPFRALFPKKKHIYLPYYPNLDYIPTTPHRAISRCCKLLYSGPLTAEKGFDRVLESLMIVAQRLPQVHWRLTLISNEQYQPTSLPANIEVTTIQPLLPFTDFCNQLQEHDLFLDLRQIDAENTRCLPIKLFYYMAAGRPCIYSRLRAIEKAVPEIDECAQLVSNAKEAADAITAYVTQTDLYQSHCQRARHLANTRYQWADIEHLLTKLVDAL